MLELGAQVRLEVLETPGHTPESISIVVRDLEAGDKPHAVLTGDTLFIGDVGRPDLLVSVGITSEELGGLLYDSLREKLMPLPDETLVYPAHGAGSACGKSLSKETSATLGSQRRGNWALQPMSKQDFVRELTANQPHAPGYFAWSADYNRRARPMLDEVVERSMVAIPLDQALQRQARGALLLDVREPGEYAAAHLAGSINVGLSGRYAGWVGTVVPQGADLILVAEPGSEHEAMTRLARIGYDTAVGYIEGGAQALATGRTSWSATAAWTSPSWPGSSTPPPRPWCSTCARPASGSAATSRAVSTCRWTCSRPAWPRSRATGRSSSPARAATAPRSPRACWSATACPSPAT